MKKMMFIMIFVMATLLSNYNSATAGVALPGGAEGTITITLTYMGLKWPVCDGKPSNCVISLKVKIGSLTNDPVSGGDYFDMLYVEGNYDTDNDGKTDIRKETSDVGSRISLGEFTLPADLTNGAGEVLVEVIDAPIDQETGIFRAYVKR